MKETPLTDRERRFLDAADRRVPRDAWFFPKDVQQGAWPIAAQLHRKGVLERRREAVLFGSRWQYRKVSP